MIRCVALALLGVAAMSGEPLKPVSAPGTSWPRFLYASEGAKKIIEYAPDGSVAWEYPAEMSRDVWRLPNGNVLFCFNQDYAPGKNDNPSGVMEVTREKTVAFKFSTTGQVWSCQRLADGNTLVGAASQGKVLLVNLKGEITKEIKVLNAPGHSCMRNARQIPNGNFLVAEESAHAVREYDPEGQLGREIKVRFAPYSAVRLSNGNTTICGQLSMLEVSADGKTIWSLEGSDVPEMGVRWFAGIQAMPNGNIFICNAGGRIPFFEITRDKQIVWKSCTGWPGIPMGHGVHLLDVPGPACK